ncbi:MAG: imidazolonepropionase [Candidatus Fermentibacteraceae bacterium]|nr:imidazolonepropionase [Candidatus Fermentibacteraceae bacterium]
MRARADLVLRDIGQLLTMDGSGASGMGLVNNAVLCVKDGKVLWAGPAGELDSQVTVSDTTEFVSAGGGVVTPGFVDSHTHPIFGATRQEEFAMRAAGADYREIAAAGGGILNSVRKTRAASEDVLENNMKHHLAIMLSGGTTTVEVKSGYGLDLETELRCLEVAGRVAEEVPQTIVPTFMGAHEVPEEFAGKPDEYIDHLIDVVNPAVKKQGIAEFVDIFCEKGVFTPEQAERYLSASAKQGFSLKIHADEFFDTGGTAVAVRTGAVSADHLLSISDDNISLIADSSTVATLLPGTALFLNKPFPPGRKLLDAGATVAVATDFNPGSCFCDSMPLVVSLAVCQCGFTVEEALVSSTVNGAAALGLSERKGRIVSGYDADFVVWNCDDFRTIPYHLGNPDVAVVYCAGLKVYST